MREILPAVVGKEDVARGQVCGIVGLFWLYIRSLLTLVRAVRPLWNTDNTRNRDVCCVSFDTCAGRSSTAEQRRALRMRTSACSSVCVCVRERERVCVCVCECVCV